MANKIYPEFLLARLRGTSTEDLASAGVNIKAVLVDGAAYTYSDAHVFLSDIPAPARIATSANVANKAASRVGDDAMVDCDDFDIIIAAGQPSIEAIVWYIDTGTASTSRLIRYYDTGTGLPFSPSASGETRQIRVDAGGFLRLNNP